MLKVPYRASPEQLAKIVHGRLDQLRQPCAMSTNESRFLAPAYGLVRRPHLFFLPGSRRNSSRQSPPSRHCAPGHSHRSILCCDRNAPLVTPSTRRECSVPAYSRCVLAEPSLIRRSCRSTNASGRRSYVVAMHEPRALLGAQALTFYPRRSSQTTRIFRCIPSSGTG